MQRKDSVFSCGVVCRAGRGFGAREQFAHGGGLQIAGSNGGESAKMFPF